MMGAGEMEKIQSPSELVRPSSANRAREEEASEQGTRGRQA